MAMQIMDNPIDSRVSLSRSIPGQGLTNDPDSPYPWEKPPEFTDLEDGLQYVFGRLINPEAYVSIMNVIDDGTALMDITQGILFKGFTEGKWNPDLMVLLIEPTMYILAAIAEQCGIDYLLYRGDTFESYEDNEEKIEKQSLTNLKDMNSKMREELTFKKLRPSKISPESIPEEAKEIIEDFEPPEEVVSLLASRKEENNNSLLERT